MRRKFLSLAEVRSCEAQARARGVSAVARGPGGFLTAYKRAGSPRGLAPYWKRRRDGFIARHVAQLEGRNEPLWDADGRPTRRHLALVMWAYSPATRGPLCRRSPRRR